MFESTKRTLFKSSNNCYLGTLAAVVGLEGWLSDSRLLEVYFAASYCVDGGAIVTSSFKEDSLLRGSSSLGPFSGDCAAWVSSDASVRFILNCSYPVPFFLLGVGELFVISVIISLWYLLLLIFLRRWGLFRWRTLLLRGLFWGFRFPLILLHPIFHVRWIRIQVAHGIVSIWVYHYLLLTRSKYLLLSFVSRFGHPKARIGSSIAPLSCSLELRLGPQRELAFASLAVPAQLGPHTSSILGTQHFEPGNLMEIHLKPHRYLGS